jgi:hypothetical protein
MIVITPLAGSYSIKHYPEEISPHLEQVLHCLLCELSAGPACVQHQKYAIHSLRKYRCIGYRQDGRCVQDHQFRMLSDFGQYESHSLRGQ